MNEYLVYKNEWQGMEFLDTINGDTVFKDFLEELKKEFDKKVSFNCKIAILEDGKKKVFDLFNYEYDDCYKNYLENYLQKELSQFYYIEILKNTSKRVDMIIFKCVPIDAIYEVADFDDRSIYYYFQEDVEQDPEYFAEIDLEIKEHGYYRANSGIITSLK